MSAVKKRSSRLCRSRTVDSWPCLGVLVAVLGLLIGLASLSPAPALAVTEKQPYIVRFKDGVDPGREDASLARLSPRFRRVFDKVFNGATVDLTEAEAARLRSDPRVEAVEPDRAVSLAEVQVGPSWGLDRVDQRSLPLSGTYSYPDGGAAVTAYVVDTGIRADHVDFGGRVAPGMTVINDGRGTDDCDGHGTKSAGTLGGSTYGVAKTVTLVPVRIYDCSRSAPASGLIAALEWIVGHHVAGTPAVVNLSLGGQQSSLIDAAVGRVIAAGVTVVASAGNDSGDACEKSPARVPRRDHRRGHGQYRQTRLVLEPRPVRRSLRPGGRRHDGVVHVQYGHRPGRRNLDRRAARGRCRGGPPGPATVALTGRSG